MDEFSCVEVRRNKFWFDNALPIIKDVYDIIQCERENGFEHRAPKTQKKIYVSKSDDNITSEGDETRQLHNMDMSNKIEIVKLA